MSGEKFSGCERSLGPGDLRDRLIDAYSVRSFVAHTGYSEHDQFFDTSF